MNAISTQKKDTATSRGASGATYHDRTDALQSGMIDALARARRLAAVAADHADESEQQRRLADPVADAIVESGLARLVAPTALGGWAAHPATLIEVIETVAAADPSAGWCLGIGAGSNYLAGFVPRHGAHEVFTNLDRPGSGVFGPTGRGVRTRAGFRLTGRWAFASGCHHAALQASGMFAFTRDGEMERDASGAPVHRLAFVPAEAVEIDETWDTVGLRGTGSHDTVVTEQVVPVEHTMRFGDPSWSDDVIFQQPVFAGLGPCLGAVPLGAGRAALDLLEAQLQAAHANPRPGPKAPFGDDAVSQAELGRVELRLRSVRALLLDVVGQVHDHIVAGRPPARTDLALLGLACQEAMRAGVDAVDVACRLSGSGAVRDGSPLERLRRDVDTMRQHVMFSPTLGAALARQLAGLPTVAWPFLLPDEQVAA